MGQRHMERHGTLKTEAAEAAAKTKDYKDGQPAASRSWWGQGRIPPGP